jgi:Mor family transcriptional regulator
MNELIHLPPEYHPAIEDLPGDLKRVAEAIEEGIPGEGVRLTLLLAQVFHGQPVYFRTVEHLIRRWRDDRMRAEYDGGLFTAKELATKIRLSLRQVENILGQPDARRMNEKQLKLF